MYFFVVLFTLWS